MAKNQASELGEKYYSVQRKKTGKDNFVSENNQRMYINLGTPIGNETKNTVIENIHTVFGIQKDNIRISDECVEILSFDRRFQKDELKDIKHIIDMLIEID
jgi:hypothetical protein